MPFEEACSVMDSVPSNPPITANGSPKQANGTITPLQDHANGSTRPAVSTETDQNKTLRLAVLLASRSRLHDALKVLQPLLIRNPTHVEALCLQGQCLVALGNKPEAMAAYAKAMTIDSQNIPALLGCAALYKESGLLEKALEFLTTAQEKEPTSTQVLHALAVVLTDLGTKLKTLDSNNTDNSWLEHYQKAVEICSTYAPAHYNLGVAATEAGNNQEALQHYQEAVKLHANYPEAWCNLGTVYKLLGQQKEAITAFERALDCAPGHELIKANLAAALTEHGTALKILDVPDLDGAIKAYERALAVHPQHAEAMYNLGVAFTEQGEFDKAIFFYETAITTTPQCAEAHNNLGVLYRELGNGERAMQCYKAALDVRPNFPQALNNLAVMYTQQGLIQEALGLLQAAILAAPDYAEAHNNLGVLQRDVGDVVAAIDSYDRCLVLDPTNRNAGQNRLLALNYIYHGEHEVVCEAHAAWGKEFASLHPPLSSSSSFLEQQDTATRQAKLENRGDKLVVGYVSPDMFTHSVSYFAEAPLTHHKGITPIIYSCCPKRDSKTDRLQASVLAAGGIWKDVAHISEQELAQMMHDDGLDILVELTGHTANNRLGAVARRPAPIQITWIGYPNSTGLDSSLVDYRITDAICDPVDTKQTFTEELIRLPGCFLCYTPAINPPPVAPLPALENGFITFGSFNALAKETPEVLKVWSRILLAIPNSRLVLKNKPFACESVKNQYWRLFEELGIEATRVDLLPLVADTGDHLSQYSMLDISLDPWPYAGTTTTTESLFMGVPCLTLAGGCHAHNVGKSLLTVIGLEKDWVAESVDEYVDKAVLLAADVQGLQRLREGLREKMLSSPLCDGPEFVRQLEEVYWSLYHTKHSN